MSPQQLQGINIPHLDKLAHFGVFALLTLTGHLTYQFNASTQWIIWGGYGAVVEIIQAQTSYRTGDFFDFIANMLGVLAMLCLLSYIKRRHKPPHNCDD